MDENEVWYGDGIVFGKEIEGMEVGESERGGN